jgi:hypothetical protein
MRDLRRVAGALVLLLALPLMLLGLLALPFLAALDRYRGWRLRAAFLRRWGLEGKVGLLVYSNSPHWQAYAEAHWLPRVADRLVILNWSERHRWPATAPLEAAVHRHWAGREEFNPVAIVFPERGPTRVVRFWKAFRDFRHGRPEKLRAAEAELEALLAGAAR